MIIVIDTNILLSALIKDSTTRKIIVESGWEFYYPEVSFHEVRKYRQLVLEKSGMDENEYNKLLGYLLMYVKLVPEEQILLRIAEAKDILEKIDADDAVFLAAALSMENAKVWSDDVHFDKQNRVRVFKTKHIAKLFFQD